MDTIVKKPLFMPTLCTNVPIFITFGHGGSELYPFPCKRDFNHMKKVWTHYDPCLFLLCKRGLTVLKFFTEFAAFQFGTRLE